MDNEKGVAISIILTKELKKQIEDVAKRKNISRNALIRMALTEYLERQN